MWDCTVTTDAVLASEMISKSADPMVLQDCRNAVHVACLISWYHYYFYRFEKEISRSEGGREEEDKSNRYILCYSTY